jgi:hypothetical protein
MSHGSEENQMEIGSGFLGDYKRKGPKGYKNPLKAFILAPSSNPFSYATPEGLRLDDWISWAMDRNNYSQNTLTLISSQGEKLLWKEALFQNPS